MLKEDDILYEKGAFWVMKAKKGYEIYRTGITHSTRCAFIGDLSVGGLERAKDEIERRIRSLCSESKSSRIHEVWNGIPIYHDPLSGQFHTENGYSSYTLSAAREMAIKSA